MRLNENLVLREVAGDYIIVNPFNETIDMTQILTLNETAAWLWKQAEGKKFDEEYLVDLICDEYEVDRKTAAADVHEICESWQKNGLTL